MSGWLSVLLHARVRVCVGSSSLDLQASSSAAKMGIPGGRVEAGETVVAAAGGGGGGGENGVRGGRCQDLLEDRR